MNRTSRQLLSKTAEVLNRHVAEGSPLGKELAAGSEVGRTTVVAINEILREAAEGATLVCATEVDGTLLGFVARADVTLPSLVPPAPTQVPPSPEDVR